jgi:hypothetical protein
VRVVLVAIDMAAMLAFWRLLTLVVGRRRLALVFLALFGFSATVLAANAWMAASITELPALLFTILAIDGHLRWMLTRSRWHLLQGSGGLVLGVLFYEKPLLLVIYLPVLVVLFFAPRWTTRDVMRSLKSAWLIWLLDTVLLAPYVWHTIRHPYPAAPAPRGVTPYIDVGARGWFFGLIPNALGGPWQWTDHSGYLVMQPSLLVAIVDQVLLAALVIFTVRRRPSALRWWFFIALVHVATTVLITRFRYPDFGSIVSIDLRYLIDDTMLLYLAVALAAIRPVIGPLAEQPGRQAVSARSIGTPRKALVLITAGALVAAFLVPAIHLALRWHDDSSSTWLSALRSDVSHATTRPFIFDGDVPDRIVPAAFAPFNHTSYLVPLLDGDAVFDTPDGRRSYTVTAVGHLAPAHFVVDATVPLTTGMTACLAKGDALDLPLDAAVPPQLPLYLAFHHTGGDRVVVAAAEDYAGATRSLVWDLSVLSPGEGTLVMRLMPVHGRTLALLVDGGTLCVDNARVGHVQEG